MSIVMSAAHGLWHVTTEGDCEGRSIKDLGTHEGYLDDIAFALADQAEYGLRFERVTPGAYRGRPPRTEVVVSLGIESGTWDAAPAQRRAFFERMLEDRNVSVQESSYYATVKLIRGRTAEDRARAERQAVAASGLAKLTTEERIALGLELESKP